MRLGIFGGANEPQVQAVAQVARAMGAEPVVVDAFALQNGEPISNLDGELIYRGQSLSDVKAFYLRSIPPPYLPYFEKDGELRLYAEWHTQYMQSRERSVFYLAWLQGLIRRGLKVVNPPHMAMPLQYKPYQMQVLRELGAEVPRTLISNDPAAVRAFARDVREVIFKPLTGGADAQLLGEAALTRLDALRASPVIFQERVRGDDVRVTLVGGEVVSCVIIDTGSNTNVDFRSHPGYSKGQTTYRELELPAPVAALCRESARACGLSLCGIDLKRAGDRFVFLELNASPIYLEIERKTGHRISEHLVRTLMAA
jgi:glutathione synthase/RimK-type ligase-like ATP-grasp enzyme